MTRKPKTKNQGEVSYYKIEKRSDTALEADPPTTMVTPHASPSQEGNQEQEEWKTVTNTKKKTSGTGSQPSHKSKRGNFVCEECGDSFNTCRKLGLHEHRIHDKEYTCFNCGRGWYSSDYFEEHKKKACKKNRDLKPLPCHCGKEFSSEISRGIHQTWAHGEEHQCKDCGKLFMTSEAIIGHQRDSAHSWVFHFAPKASQGVEGSAVPEGDETKCHCGESFSDVLLLGRHQTDEHTYFFECLVCKKRFEGKEELKDHLVATSHGSLVEPSLNTTNKETNGNTEKSKLLKITAEHSNIDTGSIQSTINDIVNGIHRPGKNLIAVTPFDKDYINRSCHPTKNAVGYFDNHPAGKDHLSISSTLSNGSLTSANETNGANGKEIGPPVPASQNEKGHKKGTPSTNSAGYLADPISTKLVAVNDYSYALASDTEKIVMKDQKVQTPPDWNRSPHDLVQKLKKSEADLSAVRNKYGKEKQVFNATVTRLKEENAQLKRDMAALAKRVQARASEDPVVA